MADDDLRSLADPGDHVGIRDHVLRAITNPVPSSVRGQLGAMPSIFTTLRPRPHHAGGIDHRGSGFGTFSAVSAPSAPNTCMYGPLASSRRSAVNSGCAPCGMSLSTPLQQDRAVDLLAHGRERGA